MRGAMWLALVVPLLMISPASAATWTVRDITEGTGLAATEETWTVDSIDYDHDGLMDALIQYHDQGGKLWHNDGDGTMSWVARSAWPEYGYRPDGSRARVDRHASAWGDIDGNGLIDAYTTVGRTGQNNIKDATHDNELWLQGPVGMFTDVGTEKGVGDPYGRGRSAVMFDADGDARLDLYVMNETPRPDDPDRTTRGQNHLFLNVGDAHAPHGFRLVPAPGWGIDRFLGYGRTAVAFDENGDNRTDLLVAGRARLFLYRNTGTAFTDVSTSVKLVTGHVQDVELADVDRDGGIDLVELRIGSVGWQRDLGGTFAATRTIGTFSLGWSVAVADADGNGSVDVYAQRGSRTSNPLGLLYLNGGGTWSVVTMPGMSGHGTDVGPLKIWPNRPPVFIVLNGGYSQVGPVKVLQLVGT